MNGGNIYFNTDFRNVTSDRLARVSQPMFLINLYRISAQKMNRSINFNIECYEKGCNLYCIIVCDENVPSQIYVCSYRKILQVCILLRQNLITMTESHPRKPDFQDEQQTGQPLQVMSHTNKNSCLATHVSLFRHVLQPALLNATWQVKPHR